MQIDKNILRQIVEELLCDAKVYVHRTTGEVIAIPAGAEDTFMNEYNPWEEEQKKVDAASNDYLRFKQMGSREGYQIMEMFIDQLQNVALSQRLSIAIQKKRPFAHFNAEIHSSGPCREQWFQFREKQYMDWVAGQWEDMESQFEN